MTGAEKGLVDFLHFLRSCDLMRQGHRPSRADGFLYRGPDHFLVEHAKLYAPKPLPSDGMALLKAATKRKRLKVRHCFQNAAEAVLFDSTGRLTYCEGYALRMIPVHHAWVILDGDIVVDLTWNRAEGSTSSRLADKVIAEWDRDTFAYFGVPFSTARLRRSILRSRMYDSLLYANDLALMREPFDASKELSS
jgi:hypothetical protein